MVGHQFLLIHYKIDAELYEAKNIYTRLVMMHMKSWR